MEKESSSIAYRGTPTTNNNGIGLGEVKRQSEFDREGGILGMNIEQLFKTVALLEDRIGGILRPPEIKESRDRDNDIADCSTELGKFIKNKSEMIDHVNRNLASILSRIEI